MNASHVTVAVPPAKTRKNVAPVASMDGISKKTKHAKNGLNARKMNSESQMMNVKDAMTSAKPAKKQENASPALWVGNLKMTPVKKSSVTMVNS